MVNTQNQSPIVVGLVASLIVVLALALVWIRSLLTEDLHESR